MVHSIGGAVSTFHSFPTASAYGYQHLARQYGVASVPRHHLKTQAFKRIWFQSAIH